MSLIERIEAAEVGSAGLDRDVGRALGVLMTGERDGVWGAWDAPWTTSIDAAVALAGRVVGGDHALTLLQDVLADHNSGGLAISDIPLRLCAAILRAKEGES